MLLLFKYILSIIIINNKSWFNTNLYEDLYGKLKIKDASICHYVSYPEEQPGGRLLGLKPLHIMFSTSKNNTFQ